MTNYLQLQALIRKNFISMKRNYLSTLCELIFPLILMIIIVILRKTISKTDIEIDPKISDFVFVGNSTAFLRPRPATTWNGLFVRESL
jgi:hypothetical protein